MSEEYPLRFLSRDQVSDLSALAERARQQLSRFADRPVAYDVESIQLLDEWFDDYLERTSSLPAAFSLLWTSFLGEMFRRHHEGRWALQDAELIIVCPTATGQQRLVKVRDQIDCRVASGMAESLTYFYNATRIALKLQ